MARTDRGRLQWHWGVPVVVLLLSVAGSRAALAQSQQMCWIDAATGIPVKTGPPGWSPTGAGGNPGENPDSNHVEHGGHTFVRLPDGAWIDAATGNPVQTGPPGWSPTGAGGKPGENPDANHVEHGGHTFVRVPCPQQPRVETPPSAVGRIVSEDHPCPWAAAVLAEINAARIDPAAYARSWPSAHKSLNIDESLIYLDHLNPMRPLEESERLKIAAARHAADQGSANPPGHIGTDGSTLRDRIQGAGAYSMYMTEEISLGQDSGAGVVRQLIIDAGSPGRLHRIDLFSPLVKFAGVGCGPNTAFHTVTVIDMTGDLLIH